jgi:hypothetical protein
MTDLSARVASLPPPLRDLVLLVCDLSADETAHLMSNLRNNIGSIDVHFDQSGIKLFPRAKAAERSRATLQHRFMVMR